MAVDLDRAIDPPGAAAGLAVSQLKGLPGLRLAGQADVRAVDLLKRAIAALPTDAAEIHLQLAGLEFIDVAAARELVALTTRPPRPRLVLHHPPAIMLRLLSLCWPETEARIVIGAVRPDGAQAGRSG